MTKAEFDKVNWNKDTKVKCENELYDVLAVDFSDRTIYIMSELLDTPEWINESEIESVKQKESL